MTTTRERALYVFAFVLCVAAFATCEEPTKTTLCQVKNDPANYNHMLVEITGFASHAFEDFTLSDPNCPLWPGVWLEYGGTVSSRTTYCCGISNARNRPQELTVEHIPISLIENQQFRDFDRAIQPPLRTGLGDATVHVTLVGRFFSGRRIEYPNGHVWGGYGHMGCCSLLAIQQVKDPDTQVRADLDYGYGAPHDSPDIVGSRCPSLPIAKTPAQMEFQKEADSGTRDWAFGNPHRVALEALRVLAHVSSPALSAMKQTQRSQGRVTYKWKAAGRGKSYTVVVSRPYWLSFYAHDANRVAWVAVAANETPCIATSR
jgi:hypothetical protein